MGLNIQWRRFRKADSDEVAFFVLLNTRTDHVLARFAD